MITALELRRRALAEAMAVKTSGLRSEDEAVRQRTATEIIEWEMGRAAQKNENKNSGEVRVIVERG
jgi:hypothetical protein